jgi:hypothetical protein
MIQNGSRGCVKTSNRDVAVMKKYIFGLLGAIGLYFYVTKFGAGAAVTPVAVGALYVSALIYGLLQGS